MKNTDRAEFASRRRAAIAIAETAEERPEDVFRQVAKILRVKRWEVREEPFRGFGSPPGRF